MDVGGQPAGGTSLLDLYDVALPHVYGYLLRRCGSAAIAEDLTSQTFVAAVTAVQRNRVPELTTAWLIAVARNKLVDHWRRAEREQRTLDVVARGAVDVSEADDGHLDALLAHEVLGDLAPQHRGALTLRHIDGLPVAEVARHLGRTVGATEVLLVRAKRAFRAAYEARTERSEETR